MLSSDIEPSIISGSFPPSRESCMNKSPVGNPSGLEVDGDDVICCSSCVICCSSCSGMPICDCAVVLIVEVSWVNVTPVTLTLYHLVMLLGRQDNFAVISFTPSL